MLCQTCIPENVNEKKAFFNIRQLGYIVRLVDCIFSLLTKAHPTTVGSTVKPIP